MTNNKELLRGIPKVDELLAHPGVAPVVAETASPTRATEIVRDVLERLRADILQGLCTQLPTDTAIAAEVARRIRQAAVPSLRRVINATGVILHTNLGRAPLADSAVEAVCAVAKGYSTLEYNLQTAGRGSRYEHVENLLTTLTGAEAALVVNNNAAAVMLALSALAAGKEVVVSRGELVEIGGAFRVPDVMEQSGCTLREVGTTNRTRAGDYESAIDAEETGALLKVHTSNYKISGFTEETSLEQLVELGRRRSLPVLYDLGSGAIHTLADFGIHGEPCVSASVQTGADVVCFSGDKLLGGPQAGILLGKTKYIAQMKKHPLTRALRIDKLTLAALEGTLRLYAEPEQALQQIPILQMLHATPAQLREKAERLCRLATPCAAELEVVAVAGQMGGGSLPDRDLPSAAVAVTPQRQSIGELESALRTTGAVPVIARLFQDRLLLDVRTVADADLPYVAERLQAALQTGEMLP